MPDKTIEDIIGDILEDDTQGNALDLVAYLRTREMSFERGKGYWEGKFYWIITYKSKSVCYILINGPEEKDQPWIIWSDDSDSNWFADFPLDEHTKEIAWKNVDICGNCGGCGKPGGTRKTVFGKEFCKVCRTAMRFINPDIETLDCIKKMIDIRKNDIIKNT